MSELKISVSGIRGIWGDSLTLETLFKFTKAFGHYLLEQQGHKILVGRDARPTGKLISSYVESILNAMGLDTVDIGIVPTPTVLFGVRKRKFDGGIIVTASHNPIQWNALKFVKRGGVFTGEQDLEKILSYLNSDFQETEYQKIGFANNEDSISDQHIEAVLSNIDLGTIRKKEFKVLHDPVNSAGSLITQWMLVKMGCHVKTINGDINGGFSRKTEPTPENLRHMEQEILNFGGDVGFAQDPDADRLVLVDERGRILSEEMTLALTLEDVLSQKKGDVVINMSTSRMNQDIAEKYGVKIFRSKVGEANVVEEIKRRGALIGGEGNGGVIYPAINTGRDSLVGIALVLELMARSGKKLSELADDLPRYVMKKEKFDFQGNTDVLHGKIREVFPNAVFDTLDGLRLDWEDKSGPVWLHIRPSNTEPVLRIIGEARDKGVLDAAMNRVKALLSR